jgi:hypothetical protein
MVPSLASEKFPVTPLGIDPETSRLVAQCLNHYATQSPSKTTGTLINEILLYRETVLHSASKERLSEACVLRHEVHHLQSCFFVTTKHNSTVTIRAYVYCYMQTEHGTGIVLSQ